MQYYYIPDLKEYRLKTGLTAKDLADHASISYRTLLRVEKGQRCKLKTAHNVIAALNKSYYNDSRHGPLSRELILETKTNNPGPR